MDQEENKVPPVNGEELLQWFEETMETVNQENPDKKCTNAQPLIQVINELPDTVKTSKLHDEVGKKLATCYLNYRCLVFCSMQFLVNNCEFLFNFDA